jgi:Zn-dependent protease with chaperone function
VKEKPSISLKMSKLRKVLAVAITAAAFVFASLPESYAESSEPELLALQGVRRPSSARQLDKTQVERLQRIMAPLLRAMNHPRSLKEVRVGVMDDRDINAANAGDGRFFVTTGLLEKANDDRLRGVLAHEIAHDDLGHVAKAQLLGTGLTLGMVLLEQVIPGSSGIAPIAGTLIARGYSRSEEFEADRHGVEILRRAGYSKEVLIDALGWIKRTSGNSGGGFLSTHPGTEERIEALEKMR